MNLAVYNFYKFIELDDLETLKDSLDSQCEKLNIRGTILLSPEGINANLGGQPELLDQLISFIKSMEPFSDLIVKKSLGKTVPFSRMRVKIKERMLTFDPDIKLSVNDINQTKRLSAQKVAELLDTPPEDLVVLDTRNDYEVLYGAFEQAEHLNIRHFKDFAKAFRERYSNDKDKTFLMYCTGGIRCEKATAFAEKEGFKNVYQLDGGIVNYFDECKGKHWRGSCFVFDFRWAISPENKESGEGHYLEDDFKGTNHEPPQKALDAQLQWP